MNLNHTSRILAIDALRGVAMLLMLVDHVREFFYLHRQVPDPMLIADTPPDLFFTRLISHVCAPIFVFLSGLSAYLAAQKYGFGRAALSRFLFTRGLLLVVLEITLVSFAWTFALPPAMLYLQVIWAIGLSMMALGVLIWLPLPAIVGLGLLIVGGHNLLTSIDVPPASIWHIPWAILHDRSVIPLVSGLQARTSYPVLPWIGVMALGYACGRLFRPARAGEAAPSSPRRERYLWLAGLAMLGLYGVLRATHGYGQAHDWQVMESGLHSVMAFLNVTKYPPSLVFLLLTLGISALLFAGFERLQHRRPGWMHLLATFGRAPLFFYISHLYLIHLLYLAALELFGANYGLRFGFDAVAHIWLLSALLAPVLYALCRAFQRYKHTHPKQRWLRFV